MLKSAGINTPPWGNPLSDLPHGGPSAPELHEGAVPPEVGTQPPFDGL